MTNDPLIETYKGINIFFKREDSHLYGKDENTGETFSAKYLFEIHEKIDEPYWEEYHAKGFVKSGYFGKELQRVQSIKRDRKSKKCRWVVTEATGSSYDVGKEIENWKEVKVYPWTEEREKIYNEVKSLEDKKTAIERSQQEIIKNL